ncbi:MAG TPA: glutathione S-transferase [Candidatus Aquabacterium excrementipullorum]|nr:glutathione S-transferase [Candidatus Aquabacterium excrementipullorum]
MKLIGMLDSPYVRRVAISLELLGVPFEHEAVSVFSTFERFQFLNPVVKAPTLITDDGTVLMDSSLILQYVEATLTEGRTLWSANATARLAQFRAVGLALAACEKSVQLVYERQLRPAAAQHEPWVKRVTGQLLAAYAALEAEVQHQQALFQDTHSQSTVSAAVAWQFTQSMLAREVEASRHPGLQALSARIEPLSCFLKFPPTGPGVPASGREA